jgi:chromosome segregation ATPase
MQLQDKVQKLIEQYSKDKKRLVELETLLQEKSRDSKGFTDEINSLKNQLQIEKDQNVKLLNEVNALKAKNKELETSVNKFETFADDLTLQIDKLIPQIEKL